MSQPTTVSVLSARVRSIREQRKAASLNKQASPDAEDPTNRGVVSIPKDPDGNNPEKIGVPGSSRPSNNKAVTDGVTTVTNPSGHGQNVPPVVHDQNAMDAAATSPTSPLSKIATSMQGSVNRLKQLRQQRDNGGVKAASPQAPAPTSKEANNRVAGQIGALTDEHHLKLAAELLSCQEGIDTVTDFLTKRAGQKAAQGMIHDALSSQRAFEKQAAEYEQFVKQAFEAEVNETTTYAAELLRAPFETQQNWVKCAAAHQTVTADMDPFMAEFYKAGAVDAGMMEDLAAGGAPEAPLPGADPAGPGDDQIAQVLELLVSQGAIDPATAQQILTQSVGGGEEAAPAEAAPAEAAPEGEKAASFQQGLAADIGFAASLIDGWSA